MKFERRGQTRTYNEVVEDIVGDIRARVLSRVKERRKKVPRRFRTSHEVTSKNGKRFLEMDHASAVGFLDAMPLAIGVNTARFVAKNNGKLSGSHIYAAAASEAIMKRELGLDSRSKRTVFCELVNISCADGECYEDVESDDDDGEDDSVGNKERDESDESDESDDDEDDDKGRDDEDESIDESDEESDDEISSSDDSKPQPPPAPPMTATACAALSVLNAPPPGTRGALFDKQWLATVSKAHDPHMGAENLGPALYSLCRFVKPKVVLEIGAGYTSLFLCQALFDNDAEMRFLDDTKHVTRGADDARGGQAAMRGMPPDVMWFDPRGAARLVKTQSLLHCVDDLSHPFCTAQEVGKVAKRLGIDGNLRMYDGDAWQGVPPTCAPKHGDTHGGVEMLWIDFGVGDRLDEFLETYWPSVAPGGLVVVHSTVTNKATRAWLERVRCGDFRWLNQTVVITGKQSESNRGDAKKRKRDAATQSIKKAKPTDEVHHVSFLEPHKRYQNAFTVLQKRPFGWAEPVFTDEA